ncbi:MAG: hypothetical protein ACR2OB_11080 [Solirubrobacteraceae bacterium]
MRSVSQRSARWLRVSLIGAVAAALALIGGIALGAPQGGAPQLSTQAPDPVSFTVATNGSPTSRAAAVGVLCFDKAFDRSKLARSRGTVTLFGYGQAQTLSAEVRASKVNRTNADCLNVSFPAERSVGADLNSYTLASVDQGAVRDMHGRPSVPGAVGVTPAGMPEITPQLGETTGPKLTAVVSSTSTPYAITYIFNRRLDPGRVPDGSQFGYVQSNGGQVRGTGAPVLTGETVVVKFANSVLSSDDVRQFVDAGAVETQTQQVKNPPGAVGGAVPSAPSIVSAMPAPGVDGAFDVTYDQPVRAKNASKFAAYREDNSTVPGARPIVTSISPTTLQVSYPQSPTRGFFDVAKYAAKIVKIVDLGGAAMQPGPASNPSILGEGATATPPMREGFTTGPTLIGVWLNPNASIATYTFDGHGGSLLDYAPATLGLVHANGDTTMGADCSQTVIAGATIVAHFTRRQLANAVGGTIAPGGPEDNQGSRNIGRETSGNGSATGSNTTGTPTKAGCRLPSNHADVRASKHGVSHGRTRVSFSGTVFVPRFVNKSRVCYGRVHIKIMHGPHVVATENVGLSRRCTFSGSATVGNRQLNNDGGRVYASFSGNRRLFGEEHGQSGF